MTPTLHAPWPAETRYLHTGGLIIDLCYRQIVQPGGTDLPQRLFDLLLLLMAEPHSLHTRAELFERLWPGVVVEDANLTQSVWLLRRALGEERKHWIRTVAKGGYVFEPPGPVEALMHLPATDTGPQVSAPGGADACQLPPEEAATAPSTVAATSNGTALPAHAATMSTPASKRRWLSIAALLLGAVVAGGAGVWMWSERKNAAVTAPAPAPVTVAVVTVRDPGSSTQWPAQLLYEWVTWKLGSLPEVTLLKEADLAAGAGAAPPTVIFLASGDVPDDSGKVVIRARFQEAGREQRFEEECDPSDVARTVDVMSRQILERITPLRAGQPWPRLELSDAAARRYADATQAREHRNWMEVAAITSEVVVLAPRFGLARAQLAQAQSRLAQRSSASQQMDEAIDLLQPAPEDVIALLGAQRLALEPARQTEAADAFGKLVARHPGKDAYSLQYASLLVRSDRPKEALAVLTRLHHERAPLGLRIARLLSLAETYQALGDPERMRQSARAAERLARNAGAGWEGESGTALLLIAAADALQHGPRADTKLFLEAADQLERAGNATGALYARFLAEVRSAPPSAGPNPRMDKLLAQAHAGGYRDIEINILFHLANQHHNAGDLAGYREKMEQATSVAKVSGNVAALTRIDTSMLLDDYLRARLLQAEERLQRLRSGQLQGRVGIAVDTLEAALASGRGNYRGAVEILERSERNLPSYIAGEALSVAQADLACGMAEKRLALGDLANARKATKRCGSATNSTSKVHLVLLNASIDQLAGDRESAALHTRRARGMLPTLADSLDRWVGTMDVAQLLTRLGDPDGSDSLLKPMVEQVKPTDYKLILATIYSGLAENAAARGDWAASRQYVAAARAGLPDNLWLLTSRLAIIEAAAAKAAGDRERASLISKDLYAEAQRLGDVRTQLEVHSVLSDVLPSETADRDLIARTGMRGAFVNWMSRQ